MSLTTTYFQPLEDLNYCNPGSNSYSRSQSKKIVGVVTSNIYDFLNRKSKFFSEKNENI